MSGRCDFRHGNVTRLVRHNEAGPLVLEAIMCNKLLPQSHDGVWVKAVSHGGREIDVDSQSYYLLQAEAGIMPGVETERIIAWARIVYLGT
jgi:hypothetical protein